MPSSIFSMTYVISADVVAVGKLELREDTRKYRELLDRTASRHEANK